MRQGRVKKSLTHFIRDDLSFDNWGIYLLSHVEDRLENVEMQCSPMCLDW